MIEEQEGKDNLSKEEIIKKYFKSYPINYKGKTYENKYYPPEYKITHRIGNDGLIYIDYFNEPLQTITGVSKFSLPLKNLIFIPDDEIYDKVLIKNYDKVEAVLTRKNAEKLTTSKLNFDFQECTWSMTVIFK